MGNDRKRPPRSRALLDYEFQRAYRACLPCRERKVKCQSTGDNSQAPCVRCSKQGLQCTFSAKVPWSRPRQVPEIKQAIPVPPALEQTISRLSPRQQMSHAQRMPRQKRPIELDGYSTASSQLVSGNEESGDLQSSLLRTMVSGESDAMDILFEAATCAEPIDNTSYSRSETALNCLPSGRQAEGSPDSLQQSTPQRSSIGSQDYDVLGFWNACRFVKMGWFTAHEATILVDLFFRNMSNQSPILTDFYASPTNQYWLITQEPMLCCTILAISSRYHTLPGPGGKTRGLFIHHRLWQHCQHLLLRLILGQEKASKAKTRNVSTIEALLLIVEWCPLSVHFPPDSDGWDSDLLLTMPDTRDPPPNHEIPALERWKRGVIEPTKRLEQMSWMVLSCALALSHEVGIFDRQRACGNAASVSEPVRPDAETYTEHLKIRRKRIPKLLYCFINLMSSRLGCTSFMCPASTVTLLETAEVLNTDHDQQWQSFTNYWVELAQLTKSITDTLFPLMTVDSDEKFQACLQEKQQVLSQWYSAVVFDFYNCHYEDILFIEYQHLRILTSSIGMQRVITRYSQTHVTHDIRSTFSLLQFLSDYDYHLVEDVIDGCHHIIELIIRKSGPDENNSLRYAPIRIFSRMISASIFLLKALALGVRKTKLTQSLHVLELAISALQTSNLDDMHLAAQYGELLKVQVDRLRRSFESSVPYSWNKRTPTSHSEQPSAQPDEERQYQLNCERRLPNFALPADQPWPSSSNIIPHSSNEEEDSLNYLRHYSNGQQLDAANVDRVASATATRAGINTWDSNMGDWFSLPFDPSMAPFAGLDDDNSLDPINPCWLDVDFIWNLPP